ncbi:MAG: hypothetical protein WCJ09_08900 [Planctomycetota bacterium]|jgi:hypothetical protein
MTVHLPTGWEPRRVGANLELPPRPIANPTDLLNWLSSWITRYQLRSGAVKSPPQLVATAPSRPDRKTRAARVSPEASGFIDLCREMRNARRALGEWNIMGAPRWDGDPPRDWTDEERMNAARANLVELRDWLRSRPTKA